MVETKAPGRINLIGEHTDYNDGFVLPAAINLSITHKLKKNGSENLCNLKSLNFGESFQFDLENLEKQPNGWQNYLLGVVAEVQKEGKKLTGFDCEFGGDIPIGGGVSSSSALQVGFLIALNEVFELQFSKIKMAQITQKADHNFIGMMGGIMDQFTILHGKESQALLLDCRSLEYEYFPVELGEYEILLLNTNVAHSLADSEYNTRRAECEKGVELLNTQGGNFSKLREVTQTQIEMAKEILPPVVFNRCRHVILENSRTLKAAQALKNHNFTSLGALMYASHQSLSNLYEVSCPELDFLVEIAKTKKYVLGSRMMGGGFGGCTISILNKSMKHEFIETSAKAYKEKFGLDLTPLEVKIGAGASIEE